MNDKYVYEVSYNKNFDDYVQRIHVVYGSYESALKRANSILESWKQTAENERQFITSDSRYDLSSPHIARLLERQCYDIREIKDYYNNKEISMIQFTNNARFIDDVLKIGCLRPIDHNGGTGFYWSANIYIRRLRFED